MTNYYRSFVYCGELTPGTLSLTGDWVSGDDSNKTPIILNEHDDFLFIIIKQQHNTKHLERCMDSM